MKWLLQGKGYGLGNFVMATPAIQLLYKRFGRIPVFFETRSVGSLYKKCEFITILAGRPKTKPAWSSARPKKRRPTESDSQALCRLWAQSKVVPDTYVDHRITEKLGKKRCVAIFHGCLGDKFLRMKDLGVQVRQQMIKRATKQGFVPVILGTKRDYDKYWHENELGGCLNYLGKLSLRDSVSILSQCVFFLSNDTGLYHVAGALKKPGLVIWRKTDSIKNMSTFSEIRHIGYKPNATRMMTKINKHIKGMARCI